LVRDPQVFLFDEPLSNLDAMLRGQMRLELARLHAELGRTMIYVTHDQVEAMTLADKIVVLDKGQISQSGAPLELYNHPANRFVASFIGSPAMNFLPATVTSGGDGLTVKLGDGSLTLSDRARLAEGPVELGVRPEDISLVNPGEGQVQGKIGVVEALGNTTFVHIDTGLGPVNVEADPAKRLEAGAAVGLQLNADKVHVFDARGKAVARRG
jgi:multiple sugar transport system ATP-binding protein